MHQSSAPENAVAVRLGLIGGNIATSRSPQLHRLCGVATGLEVSYELFVPAQLGKDFEAVFRACQNAGIRGVNITYPYKQTVRTMVEVTDPAVARIGSINTVVFGADGPRGYNTDFTGFMAAYGAALGKRPPGRVALIGTGGVGRAVAFALIALGVSELRLFDREPGRAEELAKELYEPLRLAVGADIMATIVRVADSVEAAVNDADGIVNATPVGMVGHPGSPIDQTLLGSRGWAFDAVYTPVETEFLLTARQAGLDVISGYELFFHQGIGAFKLFTGRVPGNLEAIRQQLASTVG